VNNFVYLRRIQSSDGYSQPDKATYRLLEADLGFDKGVHQKVRDTEVSQLGTQITERILYSPTKWLNEKTCLTCEIAVDW